MTNQQGDVLLCQTPNGGEIEVINGVVTMSGGLEVAAYLSILGGNYADDGRLTNPETWWGNLDETDRAFRYISETQNLIEGLPVASRNLILLEQAAGRDLQWMLDKNIASSITVSASIPQLGRIAFNIKIMAEGEEENFNFTENWRAS